MNEDSSAPKGRNDALASVADVLVAEEQRLAEWRDKEAWEPQAVAGSGEGGIDLKELEFRQRRHQSGKRRWAHCCSGGGIRSACINLGVAQGLAGHKLLRRFDYLSTVSGGGYFGCWLSSWIKCEKAGEKLEEFRSAALIEGYLADRPEGTEAGPIVNLRINSNYLTPRVGALSVDFITCLMIILRNMIVNWLVLIPSFACCLAATVVVMQGASWFVDFASDWAWLVGVVAVLAILLNAYLATCLMPGFAKARREVKSGGVTTDQMSPGYEDRMDFRWGMTLLAGLSLAIWFEAARGHLHHLIDFWPPFLVVILPYLFGAIRLSKKQYRREPDGDAPPFRRLKTFCGFLFSVGLTLLAAYAGVPWLLSSGPSLMTALEIPAPAVPLLSHAIYFAFAPSIWVFFLVFGNFLLVGCLSTLMTDEDREWWSRSNAVAVLLALGWVSACAVAVGGPLLMLVIAANFTSLKLKLAGLLATQLTAGGILSNLAASPKTPGSSEDEPAPVRMGLLNAGAIVFFLVLTLLLACVNYRIAAHFSPAPSTPVITTYQQEPSVNQGFAEIKRQGDTFDLTASFAVTPQAGSVPNIPLAGFWVWLVLALVWALTARLASWLVNINQFSLHCLYRNRLVRAFIGGVRRCYVKSDSPENAFDPFTGFDTKDNYEVSQLNEQLPLHVINMTQNLIRPTNLAWQERMASSFTVSPFHTGGPLTGFRPTKDFGQGITIGTAMATSGAAANPSMGYCTSPILALLMTLFNARLGWWVGNPADPSVWKKVDPGWALEPLLSEMFGQTSEGQKYVLLSDGGHFEDLGIYEMVRRRCHFLLVIDGGADPDGTFEDLGNAVRKIRIDFGIPMDFLFNQTTPDLADPKIQHFAVARVRYKAVDGKQAADGWLLYLKGCLTGDELMDLYEYKRVHKDFPHQSTMDQWFDESQFESYRALGRHSIEWAIKMIHSHQFIDEVDLKELRSLLHGEHSPAKKE